MSLVCKGMISVSAAIPADPEYNICRAQLHNHLPHAHQHPRPVYQEEVNLVNNRKGWNCSLLFPWINSNLYWFYCDGTRVRRRGLSENSFYAAGGWEDVDYQKTASMLPVGERTWIIREQLLYCSAFGNITLNFQFCLLWLASVALIKGGEQGLSYIPSRPI